MAIRVSAAVKLLARTADEIAVASPPAPDLDALLLRLRETESDDARNELLFTCSPMVEYFVQRACNEVPGIDADALASVGYEALLKSVGTFEDTAGRGFAEHAWQAIGAAMSQYAARTAQAVDAARAPAKSSSRATTPVS